MSRAALGASPRAVRFRPVESVAPIRVPIRATGNPLASRHSKPFRLSKGLGGVQGRAGRDRMISRGGNMAEVMELLRKSPIQGGKLSAPIAMSAIAVGSPLFPTKQVRITFNRQVEGGFDVAHWRYFHDNNQEKFISGNFELFSEGFIFKFDFTIDLGAASPQEVHYDAAAGADILVDAVTGAPVESFSVAVVTQGDVE